MSEHGYNQYTYGCRCEVCREAKATYMRAKRAEARSRVADLISSKGRYLAPIARHGTIHGYADHKCRCFDCSEAKAQADARQCKAGDA